MISLGKVWGKVDPKVNIYVVYDKQQFNMRFDVMHLRTTQK